MTGYKEIFLRYPQIRDVVFVFGAGTSRPDGVPLQDDILPYILTGNDPQITDSVIGKEVIRFVKDNFTFNPDKHSYPKTEAVFGFLDYFLAQNESLSSLYTYEKIREIKEYLIKLIHYVVDIQTDKRSINYHAFWENIAKFNRNISVLTLNYDTLLEQAFDFLFRKQGYIDYAIHLMNYDRIPGLEKFNFWINPAEPVVVENDENPVPFKILKLHGSLNWKYCNCCNQTLLTPWDRKIDLNRGKFLGFTPEKEKYEYTCPVDSTDFSTLIMPPSYIKNLSQPVIGGLFSEASREIRNTRKIVFAGYSLSNADVHIKALFSKNLRENVEVFVVNNRISEKLKNKYMSLTENIRFIKHDFEEFVRDEELMEEILTK